MKKINKEELTILENFFYQVGNGGIHQWLFNGYGKDINELLTILQDNGLEEVSKRVDEMIVYKTEEVENPYYDEEEDDEDEQYEWEDTDIEKEDFDELYFSDFNVANFHDYDFYKTEGYKKLEEFIKAQNGFVSETGSIILDAIKGGNNA